MSAPPPKDNLEIRDRGSNPAVVISGIVLAAILVTLLLCCGAVLLLLPATSGSREAARRGGCLSNMRQLGLAAANHESVTKRYPIVSDAPLDLRQQRPGAPLSDPAQADGYSFLVACLPYIEEMILYDEMADRTGKFENPGGAWEANPTAEDSPYDGLQRHYSERQIPAFRCPSYAGDWVCRDDGDYPYGVAPEVGNYVAVVATDLEDATAPWKQNYPNFENGGLVSACWDGDCTVKKGLGIKHIGDGISKQIILAESRERRYAAWFSGASSWVVAATGANDPRESQGVVGQDKHGFVVLTSGQLALNWGDIRAYDSQDNSKDVYLLPAPNRWAGSKERVFGPSSEHSGSVVLHVFADAHAATIHSDVDPDLYLRLITRSDGDPVDTTDL